MLVQGDAEAPDRIETSVAGFENQLREVYRWQPASRAYGSDPLTRRLMDWYFMRLVIHVTPSHILWWPEADLWQEPFEPDRFIPGAGIGGLPAMIRFLTGSRRNAARYLKKRGLARTPWDEINAAKKAVSNRPETRS